MPWQFVNIQQKIDFQEKLYCILKSNNTHDLIKELPDTITSGPRILQFTTVAINHTSVLFAICSTLGYKYDFVVIDFDKQFNKESHSVKFYENYDTFRYQRAIPNRIEWES